MDTIRNFSIIAHIDHGKSTLADRMIEITGAIEKRKMRAQVLDSMDLERERGITIKMQPVRMLHTLDGKEYVLNLIDTPGHIDFSYEVSRALSACEGAVLLIDATQGIQAQTVATYFEAKKLGLAIVPVINKIDLPNAQIDQVVKDVAQFLSIAEDKILTVSAKSGEGVEHLLEVIVDSVPPPKDSPTPSIIQALVFDFEYRIPK